MSAETPGGPPLPPGPPPASAPLSPADERTWAVLAHLSILLNLVTGFLGLAGAFVIYLIYKDRSRYVAYQSLQSVVFQLIAWAGPGALIGLMWAVVGVLSAVFVGVLCVPFALILTFALLALPLAAVVYGIMAAVQCSEGRDFRYWLVGDWLHNLA